MFMSLDAEKAFDRLDWNFMIATLRYIGLGPRMLRMIEALYSKPSAQIRVNSTISESFPLFNGTRQGCHYPLYCLSCPWNPYWPQLDQIQAGRATALRCYVTK